MFLVYPVLFRLDSREYPSMLGSESQFSMKGSLKIRVNFRKITLCCFDHILFHYIHLSKVVLFSFFVTEIENYLFRHFEINNQLDRHALHFMISRDFRAYLAHFCPVYLSAGENWFFLRVTFQHSWRQTTSI